MVPGFPHTGVWTDALSGDTHEVTDLSASFYFAPGQHHLWMDTPVTPVAEDAPLALSSSTCEDDLALNFGGAAPCTYTVTVSLDATDLEDAGLVSALGLHVAGSFQGWSPASTPLVQDAEGFWTVSFTAKPGSWWSSSSSTETIGRRPRRCPWAVEVPTDSGGTIANGWSEAPMSWGRTARACAACSLNLDYPGCTDPEASNFDANATLEDGSCLYAVVFQVNLSEVSPTPTAVHVAGSFQGWTPPPRRWPKWAMGCGLFRWPFRERTRLNTSSCRARIGSRVKAFPRNVGCPMG